MIQDPIQVFFFSLKCTLSIRPLNVLYDPVICKISFRRKLHNEAFQATLQGQGCGAGGIS